MREKIYVSSHGSQWKVKCEHCDSTIVSTQSEAIKIAKSHVANLSPGTLSQIIIQTDDGKIREEWTYNKDPFPPKG